MACNFNDNILVRFDSSDATAGGDSFTMLRACSMYDAFGIAHAATAGTIQFFHTSTAAGQDITNAFSVNAANKTLARTTQISDVNAFAIGQVLVMEKSAAVSTSAYAYFNATGATLA